MKFYSKIKPSEILFSILRFNDIKDQRTDISSQNKFLKASGKDLKKDFKAKTHKHNNFKRETNITQESWIVIKDEIYAKSYGLDDKFIYETNLTDGDCITIFRGGHELTFVKDNTYFYEFKNGLYYDVDADKVKINE